MFSSLIIFALPLTCLAGPLAQAAVPSSTTIASTVTPTPGGGPYPVGTQAAVPGEFQYANWLFDRQKQEGPDWEVLEKIHSAFMEAQYMASRASLKLTDGSEMGQASRTRWFGAQANPEQVDNVFANIYDSDTGHVAAAVTGMVLDKHDFKIVNGTPGCEAMPGADAYTDKDTGEFHICQSGLDKPLNADISCDDLDASASLKMRSLPMAILNAWIHNKDISSAALNGAVVQDYYSGAYDCFHLGDDDKATNAQNYAWLAGEIHWSMYCDKDFEDPVEGIA